MKITRRQREFIKNLHELSQELEGPIHYSVLAERLGVSPFTAYDMLCLLEEKGLAVSEYQLDPEKNGPGRAERVFYPSVEAHSRRKFLNKNAASQNDEIVNFVLKQIRNGKLSDNGLAEEMLARIPPDGLSEEMRYCMEVMTVIALRLGQCSDQTIISQFWQEINSLDWLESSNNLSLMVSFAVGVLAQECSSDPQWVDQLFGHVKRYLEIVSRMGTEEITQLGNYFEELVSTVPMKHILI